MFIVPWDEYSSTLIQKPVRLQPDTNHSSRRHWYSSSRLPGRCHIVTLGFSAKGSSDFLQAPQERRSVEQRRVQVTMQGCKPSLSATQQMWTYLAEACPCTDERGSVWQRRVQVVVDEYRAASLVPFVYKLPTQAVGMKRYQHCRPRPRAYSVVLKKERRSLAPLVSYWLLFVRALTVQPEIGIFINVTKSVPFHS